MGVLGVSFVSLVGGVVGVSFVTVVSFVCWTGVLDVLGVSIVVMVLITGGWNWVKNPKSNYN